MNIFNALKKYLLHIFTVLEAILLFFLLGLFQADNKGETGVVGFPGPRVSTDTFRHFFHVFFCVIISLY